MPPSISTRRCGTFSAMTVCGLRRPTTSPSITSPTTTTRCRRGLLHRRHRHKPMDLQLAGKVALITGSSRGIGLATAKAFAAEGCRLMLSARSPEQLAEAEAAMRTSAVDVAAHAADVSKPDEAAGLVEATVAVFGGIDLLIN